MTRIVTVCARKNSKGLPGKNKLLLGGVPLYVRAIEQAIKSEIFEVIVVSTDDEEIMENSLSHGADIVVERPTELAGDLAGKPETIRHAVIYAEKIVGKNFTIVTDLDITSPLRDISDIKGTVKLLEDLKVNSVVTACQSRRNPYFNLIEEDELGIARVSKQSDPPYLSRQKAPKCFDMNASVHSWQRNSLI